MNEPPQGAIQFPEDQIIRKEFEVTTRWRTITFEKPLHINRKGLMGLHLAVDRQPYVSMLENQPRNTDCKGPGCAEDAFCLRRIKDGVVIRPEAILIGDNGVEVRIRPEGHLYPYFDKNIITMALRTFKNGRSKSPPFPKSIKTFKGLRIRSSEPFTVRYLYWNVDRYPFYE